jgi:hypothetical protein
MQRKAMTKFVGLQFKL